MKTKNIFALACACMLIATSCQQTGEGNTAGESRNGTNSAQGGIDGEGRTSTDPGYPTTETQDDTIQHTNE